MAIIISISEKTLPNPLLLKLKAMDKVRAAKMIEAYTKKASAQTKASK